MGWTGLFFFLFFCIFIGISHRIGNWHSNQFQLRYILQAKKVWQFGNNTKQCGFSVSASLGRDIARSTTPNEIIEDESETVNIRTSSADAPDIDKNTDEKAAMMTVITHNDVNTVNTNINTNTNTNTNENIRAVINSSAIIKAQNSASTGLVGQRETGKIQWFYRNKVYGIIISNSNPNVTIHVSRNNIQSQEVHLFCDRIITDHSDDKNSYNNHDRYNTQTITITTTKLKKTKTKIKTKMVTYITQKITCI